MKQDGDSSVTRVSDGLAWSPSPQGHNALKVPQETPVLLSESAAMRGVDMTNGTTEVGAGAFSVWGGDDDMSLDMLTDVDDCGDVDEEVCGAPFILFLEKHPVYALLLFRPSSISCL